MSDELQTFADYVFLKQHFNDFKFIWKEDHRYIRKVSHAALKKRKDLPFFLRFHKHYSDRRDRIEHLISGFSLDKSMWVGKLLEQSVVDFHNERMRRCGALEHTFETDCETLHWFMIDNGINFRTLTLTKGTRNPILIDRLPQIGVTWETLALLERFSGWAQMWFPVDLLFKQRRFWLHKYKRVLWLNERKHSKLIKSYQLLAPT